MSAINPTVKLAKIRSDIDDTQSKLAALEMLYTQLLSLAVENTQNIAGGGNTIAEIQEDFQIYAANRASFSPAEREEIIGGLISDTAGVLQDANVPIPQEFNRDGLANAWMEFAETTQDPAVVKVAITNLKASLGALRNEESAWREQGMHEQKMQNETMKLAQI